MNSKALATELQELYLAAAPAAAARIRSLNLPVTVPIQVVSVDRSETGWQSQVDAQTVNYLSLEHAPFHNLAPLLTPEAIAIGRTCAATLAADPEARLPFFSAFTPGHGWALDCALEDFDSRVDLKFDEDPTGWTLTHLLWPALLHHLQQAPSLDSVTPVMATAFAEDVIGFATSSHLDYVITIPLFGVKLAASRTAPLTAGNAQLRSLTAREQGRIMQAWRGTPHLQTLPQAELTLTVQADRDQQMPYRPELIDAWLNAFYLNGHAVIGREMCTQLKPPWASAATSRVPLRSRDMSFEPQANVSPAAFRKIQATADTLAAYNLARPASAHDLALHRFLLGSSRTSPADAVVDFVIALEALLLPYDKTTKHGDLTFRFRMHGARFLARSRQQRSEIYKQLDTLYDLRSRLVHGGKFPAPNEIEEGRKLAELLARDGLLKALASGFPDPAAYKKMLLDT